MNSEGKPESDTKESDTHANLHSHHIFFKLKLFYYTTSKIHI